MNEERDMARIMSADFVLDQGFAPGVNVRFDYDEGGTQHLAGWFVDTVFLVKLLQVFGAESMDGLVGKYAYVTHTHSSIEKIEPVMSREGTAFDIRKWSKWKEGKQTPPNSGREYDELDFS